MTNKRMNNHVSHVISKNLFSPIPPHLQVAGYAAKCALIESGDKLSVRVDWNGDVSKPGSFEIKLSDGTWFACQNLDIDSDINDLIFPASAIQSDLVTLALERGPTNQGRAFAVLAIPIIWSSGFTLPQQSDDDFVAIRGENYQYRDGTVDESWEHSQPEGDTQRATLKLAGGVDYEIWVDIQHPSEDDVWKKHDPVMTTGDPQQGTG